MTSLVEDLNSLHFIVRVGGKTRVGTDGDGKGNPLPLELSTFQDFKDWYYGRTISLKRTDPETGAEEMLAIPIAKYWLSHSEARRYRGITFDPSRKEDGDVYNIWRGFAVPPVQGDWSLFRTHLKENVCDGEEEVFGYVLRWMAYAVQHPERPAEVALVVRGAKGTGKGTFANAFGRLFTPHYLAISNRSHLTGRFNAHLMQTVVLFVDEGFWAGDREGEGVLKQLITEPELPIERKFFDVEHVPNRLHVIIASNESWVVPARGLERRFLVVNVNDRHARDTAYFGAIWKQLQAGGYSAMLFDLLAMDLSDFEVRRVPMTDALQEQMLHSLTSFEAWWFGRLMDGALLVGRSGWGDVALDALHGGYMHEAEGKHTLSKQQFVAELDRMLPPPGAQLAMALSPLGRMVKTLSVPGVVECRKEWERQRGIKVKWLKGEADG